MKATIESTSAIVDMRDHLGQPYRARVWHGVTETGVEFTLYIARHPGAALGEPGEVHPGSHGFGGTERCHPARDRHAVHHLMPVVRKDTIPAIRGMPAVRIVTMTDGSVVLQQGEEDKPGEQMIMLHAYQAAEIAGFLWPAESKPKLDS